MDFGHEFELPQTPKSAPRDGMMSPDLSLPVHGPGRDSRNNGTSQWATSSQSRLGRYAQSSTRTAQSRPEITPPNSDPDSNNFSYPVSFEIYFPAPSDLSRTETLRYHLTTRNVFALLIHKSLVGTSLGQTLKDLHERMEMYMPEDFDTTSLLIDYVVVKGLDDIRNDPSSAAGLLIWSETVGVNWVEAWREAYVTCVALYSRIRGQPEYRAISAISRALMERANLELSVRIQHAEDRLIAFDFTDMWPTSSLPNGPSRDAFGRFSKFLIYFYNTSFWSWPPPGLVQNGQWLNRNVALRLQKDFGALYDYIVDRDVSWEEGENRSPGGKRMRKRGFETQTFRADTDDLPITDILVGFDRKYRYPHVPHPFPLQPESIPVHPSVRAKKTNKRDKSSDARTIERRVAMAYSEATNLYILGSGYESNELVEAFVQFEKSDKVTETNPIEARKGRWILLYGILQTLATITVDTPGLRWTDDVPYFLGPKLKGTPPWRTQNEEGFDEATHENSHCWRVPREWPGHDTSPKSDLSLDAVPNPSIYRANTRASERTRSRAERLMPNTPNHIQKVNNVIGSKRFQSDYINETLRKSEEEREADEHNWARELDKQRTRAADQTSSKAPSRATNRSREQLSQTDLQDLQALVQADEIGADHRWRLEEMERQQAHMPHPQDLERSPSPPIETGHIVDVQQQQHTSGTHTSELDWKELRKKQARERISKDLLKAGPQRQHQANNPVVNRLQSLGEEIEEIRLGDSAHQNGLNSMGTSNAVSSRHSLSKNMSSEQISQQQHSRSHGVARHMGATGSSESIGNSTSYGLLSRTNGTSYNHTNEDRRDAHQRPTRRDTDEVSRERPRDPREQIRDVSISPPNASFTTVSSMPSGQPQTYYTTASPPQSPGSGPSGTAAATGAGSMPIPIPRPSSSRGQKGKSPTVPPGGWPSPGQQSALGMGGGHHISELMHGNGSGQGGDSGRSF